VIRGAAAVHPPEADRGGDGLLLRDAEERVHARCHRRVFLVLDDETARELVPAHAGDGLERRPIARGNNVVGAGAEQRGAQEQ
jgi:hypothetical protein